MPGANAVLQSLIDNFEALDKRAKDLKETKFLQAATGAQAALYFMQKRAQEAADEVAKFKQGMAEAAKEERERQRAAAQASRDADKIAKEAASRAAKAKAQQAEQDKKVAEAAA